MSRLTNTFKNLFARYRSPQHNEPLVDLLGFTPLNYDLYHQALLHRSLKGEDVSNERLEFLGDAILSLIVSSYLFEENQSVTEGELTRQRSKLVNRVILNKMALELGVDQLLRVDIGEKNRPKNIYGNALEALIGAVYLDRGLKVASDFVLSRVIKVEERASELLNEEIDFKSKLIEHMTAKGIGFKYDTNSVESNEPTFRSMLILDSGEEFSAEGSSKKEAEQNVSALCLNQLSD